MLPVHITPGADGESIRIELPLPAVGAIAAIKRKLHTPTVRLVEPEADVLLAMLATQSAEGAFAYWPAGSTVASMEISNELAMLAGKGVGGAIPDAVLATVMCLLAMQTSHAARRDLWQRAHAKACGFVAKTLGVKMEELTGRLNWLARTFAARTAGAAAAASTA
jgi:hypothetical protein